MITYQQESYDDVDEQWFAMFEKHYQEIAWKKDRIKLKPDYEKYKKMHDMGFIKIYTVRDEGQLLGYAIWFVMFNLHYSDTLKAMNDILYIDQAKRHGRLGINLIKYCETELKKLGAHTIGMHIKHSFDWGNMAERLGYEPVETLYEKWIGD